MEAIVISIAVALLILLVIFWALQYIPGLDVGIANLVRGASVIIVAAFIILKLLTLI